MNTLVAQEATRWSYTKMKINLQLKYHSFVLAGSRTQSLLRKREVSPAFTPKFAEVGKRLPNSNLFFNIYIQ